MKILVTGSTGMVGRNVLENSFFRQHELLTPKRSELDLCQFQLVLDYFKKNSPDLVLHLAGRVGGIQANMNSPVSFMIENLDIGRNVILAAFQSGVKRLINLGSSCMYPKSAENPLREEMILSGELEPTNEGYALAKIMTERLCSYIKKQDSEFRYKTLIPCNIYGKFDHFDPMNSHLVPAIFIKLHSALQKRIETVEIWGSGEARREFMYAEDLVVCLAKAVEHYDSLPDTMNVGTGVDYSINEYYQAVAKILGYQGNFFHDLSKPSGMRQKLVSVERAKNWGWVSGISLEEGLAKTYEYYLGLIKNDERSL